MSEIDFKSEIAELIKHELACERIRAKLGIPDEGYVLATLYMACDGSDDVDVYAEDKVTVAADGYGGANVALERQSDNGGHYNVSSRGFAKAQDAMNAVQKIMTPEGKIDPEYVEEFFETT